MENAVTNQRIDRLENLLGDFIVETNRSFLKTNNVIQNLADELGDFKDEMKDFKDEMKDFKDEMKDFKDEIKAENKRMNKQWGELANKMGTIVEDIIAPALPRITRDYFGYEYDAIFTRATVTKPNDRGARREFDAIVVCGDAIILNETKTTVRPEYVKNYIEFLRDGEFFDYFPQHAGKKLIPIFSALTIPANLVTKLTKNGIFAMVMTDSNMDIINFEACREKAER